MNPILYFLRDLKKTGAVSPSSKFLAEDITQVLGECSANISKPLQILELGPGTGTLSKYISGYLKPEDTFDMVEINPHFTRMLRRKFKSPNITVHYTDFLNFNVSASYDYIFSSIPYETIPEEISKQIWEKKIDLCSNGGKIIYYKYLNFNHFRCKYEKSLVKKYCIDKKIVFLNLPPANLYTLCIEKPAILPSTIVARAV